MTEKERYVAITKLLKKIDDLKEGTGIISISSALGKWECHVGINGILNADLELTRRRREYGEFPFEFSSEIDGVKFFSIVREQEAKEKFGVEVVVREIERSPSH
ncbi:hypothetical protein KHA93_11765 [Bacillus sp. FJAT-49732]|uniref:Uncharacterized protein n=1 Tax=Lederbergia citrisecunda TaxID=2833583 RepID=A0A942TN17_9BACI|nr:hypothetical protein [Lederbergia citrisecunda]MBS4200308.1 hypothetical protein [Lederbergia citrisecunda]